MKVVIKVCTAGNSLSADQEAIIKRVATVLSEHGLSVAVTRKVKKTQVFKLKAS
jgi:hypothetical protein